MKAFHGPKRTLGLTSLTENAYRTTPFTESMEKVLIVQFPFTKFCNQHFFNQQ